MAVLFESYTETETHVTSVGGAEWRTQTFTPTISHVITSVQIYASKFGSPDTLSVSIKAVDTNNHPTGVALSYGIVDGNGFPAYASPAWQEITVTAYALVANTRYAIEMKATLGDGSNFVGLWLVRNSNSDTMYANGELLLSSNSGSTWAITSGEDEDALFRDYGAYSSGELSGVIAIVEERLHYVDAFGTERQFQGTVV